MAAAETTAGDPEPVPPMLPVVPEPEVVPALPPEVVPELPPVVPEPEVLLLDVPEPELLLPLDPDEPDELPAPELDVPLVPLLPLLVDPLELTGVVLTGAPTLAPLHEPTAFAFWVILMELTAELVGAHCETNAEGRGVSHSISGWMGEGSTLDGEEWAITR